MLKFMTVFIFLMISDCFLAQFKADYIVKRDRDTVRLRITNLDMDRGVVYGRVNDEKTGFAASQLISVFWSGVHYESVFIKEDKWFFSMRYFSGNVSVYKSYYSNSSSGGSLEKYFFRQSRQTQGQVTKLNKKNLKKVQFYSCQIYMDTLLSKSYNIYSLLEALEEYNKKCEAFEK